MRTTRLLVPVLLTLALLPSTNRVEGQGIGGLVKKKAAEAVKGKDSKNDKAKTDAKDDGPTTSTFPCTVTPDVVSRFLDGLKLENARRANFESMFAGLKSHEQVVACRQQEVMG